METLITLKNAIKVYSGPSDQKTTALNISELDIFRGEFIVILGASGSGKSTFLNIVGAQDDLTSGDMIFEGKNYKNLKDKEKAFLRSNKFGFVFQMYDLVPDYSVYDNINLAMVIAKNKLSGQKKKRRITECAEAVGIEKMIRKKASALSGGEKQRCAIARALVNDPEIILADEPTGALDTKTGKEIIGLLKEINNTGKTIIIVTHDSSICNYADRIISLCDGKIESIKQHD